MDNGHYSMTEQEDRIYESRHGLKMGPEGPVSDADFGATQQQVVKRTDAERRMAFVAETLFWCRP